MNVKTKKVINWNLDQNSPDELIYSFYVLNGWDEKTELDVTKAKVNNFTHEKLTQMVLNCGRKLSMPFRSLMVLTNYGPSTTHDEKIPDNEIWWEL